MRRSGGVGARSGFQRGLLADVLRAGERSMHRERPRRIASPRGHRTRGARALGRGRRVGHRGRGGRVRTDCSPAVVRGSHRPRPSRPTTAYRSTITSPRESVVRAKPASSQPSYGDQSALVSIVDGLTVRVAVGWMIARSASAPTMIAPFRGYSPMMRAGLVLSFIAQLFQRQPSAEDAVGVYQRKQRLQTGQAHRDLGPVSRSTSPSARG